MYNRYIRNDNGSYTRVPQEEASPSAASGPAQTVPQANRPQSPPPPPPPPAASAGGKKGRYGQSPSSRSSACFRRSRRRGGQSHRPSAPHP